MSSWYTFCHKLATLLLSQTGLLIFEVLPRCLRIWRYRNMSYQVFIIAWEMINYKLNQDKHCISVYHIRVIKLNYTIPAIDSSLCEIPAIVACIFCLLCPSLVFTFFFLLLLYPHVHFYIFCIYAIQLWPWVARILLACTLRKAPEKLMNN